MNLRLSASLAAAVLLLACPEVRGQAADTGPRGSAPASFEIVVEGRRNSDPTQISEAARELVQVPGSLGDPLSAVFSLPGVVYAGGDNGAPAIRGSGPADNLFVVDSLPVPYVFHVFDISGSVFNENILRSFNLYAAGYGPEYANVTGGVFDIALRDPRNQQLTSTIDLSLLRSGIFLESAVTEHSAAYLSARASNLSLFVKGGTSSDGIVIEKPPKDNDYQFKYVWSLGDRQKLTLGAGGATDSLGVNFQAGSEVAAEYPDIAGNARTDTRYNYQMAAWDLAAAAGLRARIAASRATSSNDTSFGDGYYYDESLVRDSAVAQLDAPLGPRHTLHLTGEIIRNAHGANYNQVLYICNEFDPTCNDTRRGFVTADESLTEIERTFALSDAWRPLEALSLDLGGQYQENSHSGEHFLNPRGAATWTVTPRSKLSLKAGIYDRFPDLVDILPQIGNPHLRSSRADHFSAGFNQMLEEGWSWSAEGYYKKLWHLPLALSPSQPDASRLYSNDVSGRAYGFDILLDKKPTDRWYGWMAASIGRSTRTDERSIVTSNYYLDTPFIFNAVANFQWRPRIAFGARVTVRSGQADTPIIGVEENANFPGHVQPVFGTPYSARLPTYARLDARIKWDFTTTHPSALTLDIVNVLNRSNVDYRQLDYAKSALGRPPVLKQYDGLGILPVLSYQISF